MSIPPEGNNPPPEKSERELLLEELDKVNVFIKHWGPLYLRLLDQGENIRQEAKFLTDSKIEDEEHLNQLLEQFYDVIGEARNIESVKNEYLQNLNRRVEIEERLKELGESN